MNTRYRCGPVGAWLVVGCQPAGRGLPIADALSTYSAVEAPAPDLDAGVQRYCVRCHNARRLAGNLTLEGFGVSAAHQSAETAEKVILKLRAGMMPPPGERRRRGTRSCRSSRHSRRSSMRPRPPTPNPGTRRFRRLNRPEYERVIRDLLALDVDAGRWLPADTYLGNFDNLSAAQGLSTTLLEAYLRASDPSRPRAPWVRTTTTSTTR